MPRYLHLHNTYVHDSIVDMIEDTIAVGTAHCQVKWPIVRSFVGREATWIGPL